LLVHSSLSACGQIIGGADAVLRALRDWIGNGTLCLPAHSYCYPRKDGSIPIFDLHSTPALTGRISDVFWRQAGVLRSNHPTHSLACSGPSAAWLCAEHELCATPCGAATPYARLVQSHCSVLMFGVTLDSYTLFHTAEDAARV